MHGRGTMKEPNGNQYVGLYTDGQKNGKGTYIWADGREYQGNWRNGKQHGNGKYKAENGQVKNGIWDNGKIIKWVKFKSKAKVGKPLRRPSESIKKCGNNHLNVIVERSSSISEREESSSSRSNASTKRGVSPDVSYQIVEKTRKTIKIGRVRPSTVISLLDKSKLKKEINSLIFLKSKHIN